VFEFRLAQVDLHCPSRIIDIADLDAVGVLPVAIALRMIPLLEFSQ